MLITIQTCESFRLNRFLARRYGKQTPSENMKNITRIIQNANIARFSPPSACPPKNSRRKTEDANEQALWETFSRSRSSRDHMNTYAYIALACGKELVIANESRLSVQGNLFLSRALSWARINTLVPEDQLDDSPPPQLPQPPCQFPY